MRASVFVGTSVDGFIARRNGDFDFLPEGGGEPHGNDENMSNEDVLVIGRNTFEKVLTFEKWPYAEKRVVVLSSRAIAKLVSENCCADQPLQADVVRFVSVLSQRPRLAPTTPISFPSSGRWLLKIVARQNRFVLGLYRRHMKVISYLGALDRLYGVPATTRNWNTMLVIAAVLGDDVT